MSFKAEQRDIDYLLSNKLYEIPRNQRRYVWNKDNWDDLWSDLEFIVNNQQYGKRHFLGSIVLREEDKVIGIQRYTIIDGQQRIITMIDEPINKYASLIERDMNVDTVKLFMKSMINRLPPRESFMLKFEAIGYSNHVEFYQGSKNKERVCLVLELIEQKLSNRTKVDEFTIEHVCPDSQGEENACIGNLVPLEKGLNERCKAKNVQEKIIIYKDSNFATARKLANRIEKRNGIFDSKKRSSYLGKMLYDDIVNYLNEENVEE